jgi:hypothetical protein
MEGKKGKINDNRTNESNVERMQEKGGTNIRS